MNNQRFERKYIFHNIDINKLTLAIYRSNFNFFSSYPDRFVNSIYFDDKNLSSISDNLDGVAEKQKIRLRWYGDKEFINNSKLELKKKNEFLVNKKEFNLEIPKNFAFFKRENISYFRNQINNDNKLKIQISKKTLIPLLSTHYSRSYFLSSNKKVRLTLDKNIEYFHLVENRDFNVNYKTNNLIIELKYAKELDDYVREKIREISVRFSKNSKYIHAAQSVKII